MKEERLFSEQELRELAIQTVEKVIGAIDAGDKGKAKSLCKEIATEWLLLHDIYLYWVTDLLSYIGEKYGDEEIYNALCRFYIHILAKESSFHGAVEKAEIKEKIKMYAKIMHAHQGSFTVEEDEEKFTFINDPCGSGQKLIREGAYEPPKNFLKVKKAQPMTYGEKDFPVYCCHCAINREIMHIEQHGVTPLVTEFPKKWGDPCILYIYKDPLKVPSKYYQRVGKEKK